MRLTRLCAFAAAAILALPASAGAEIIDRILAVVSGQPITLSQVNAALQFHLIEPPPGSGDPLAYGLERLVERSLMLSEVERFQPPEPAPVEITIRVDAMEKQAGSTAAFEKALGLTGYTREQLRRYIRNDLRVTTYLNQRFGTEASPNDRNAAIAAWLADLRRRAEVIVQYPAQR